MLSKLKIFFRKMTSQGGRDPEDSSLYEPYLPVGREDDSCHIKLPSLDDQEEALRLVGLQHFIHHLSRSSDLHIEHEPSPTMTAGRCHHDHSMRDWSSSVSQGEKQRIAVARVLLHRPKLVDSCLITRIR